MHLFFFPDIAWSHLYQRPQHLASRLARRWPVLWIEPATLGTPRAWRPEKRSDNLYVISLPQFPHNAKNRRIRQLSHFLSRIAPLRSLVTMIQRSLITRACRILGIDPATTPAFVENFQFAPLLTSLRPAAVVFDYIDDAFGFMDLPAYVRDDWRQMIRLADRCCATSGVLQRQLAQETTVPVELIENGVHAASYAAATIRPADLPEPGKPLIMYVGTISYWFDFDLLDALVLRLPDANVVLIGPVHPDSAARLNASRKFTNLHIPGVRPHADIPAYLGAATVGIIPFIRNRLTEAVNPVKLYEYAAAGIPVVTTAFSDDLHAFTAIARIARTQDEFVSQVRTAIERGAGVPGPEQLRQFARENDWDVRAAAVARLIDEALGSRNA